MRREEKETFVIIYIDIIGHLFRYLLVVSNFSGERNRELCCSRENILER